MPDEPRVQELLEELLDRETTPEEVCGACPDLLPVVRERWRQICRARAEFDALLPIWPQGTLPPLPEDEREAFDLVRIQGLTYAEAAELLGVAPKTVQRRLDRGLRLLTERLGDLGPVVPPPGPS